MKKYDEFINEWKVDVKQKSATHDSGLGVSFDSYNEDGSMRVRYHNLMAWQKGVFMETNNGQEVDKKRTELTQQFAEIYSRDISEKVKTPFHVIKSTQRE